MSVSRVEPPKQCWEEHPLVWDRSEMGHFALCEPCNVVYGWDGTDYVIGISDGNAVKFFNKYLEYKNLSLNTPGPVQARSRPLYESGKDKDPRKVPRFKQGADANAKTDVNERGGTQSVHRWRFDLLDPDALILLARIRDYGARKYGESNQDMIAVNEHINAMLTHAYFYLSGDTQDDHLGHMLCRCLFAVEVAIKQGYNPIQGDER